MPDRALTFGRYRLEPRGGLTSGAREIRLTPKALALLSYLTERPGEVVTKDELFAAVWPETTVGDAALSPASRSCAARSKTMPGSRATSRRCTGAATASSRRRAAVRGPQPTARLPALPLPDRPSIAVLPFANMSGDPDQEYFADGISEDLITGLARIRWLFVIARNSTFVYKDRAVDVKQVSRALGVQLCARRQRAPGRQRACASPRSSSMRRPAAITGPKNTTARSATSSPCRTRSRAASRRRSSRICSPPRAFARSSRSADDLGAWELVARAQTYVSRMSTGDYETAIDIPRRGPSRPIRTMRRREACSDFASPSQRTWAGSIARADCRPGREHASRAIALDDRDPWGHFALGYSAMMEHRTDGVARGVPLARSTSIRTRPPLTVHLSRTAWRSPGHDRETIEHAE